MTSEVLNDAQKQQKRIDELMNELKLMEEGSEALIKGRDGSLGGKDEHPDIGQGEEDQVLWQRRQSELKSLGDDYQALRSLLLHESSLVSEGSSMYRGTFDASHQGLVRDPTRSEGSHLADGGRHEPFLTRHWTGDRTASEERLLEFLGQMEDCSESLPPNRERDGSGSPEPSVVRHTSHITTGSGEGGYEVDVSGSTSTSPWLGKAQDGAEDIQYRDGDPRLLVDKLLEDFGDSVIGDERGSHRSKCPSESSTASKKSSMCSDGTYGETLRSLKEGRVGSHVC